VRDPQNSVSKNRKKKGALSWKIVLFKEVSKEGFLGWEEAIGRIVNNYGCRLTESFFVRVDNYLAKTRKKDLKIVGYRIKTMVCKHGQLNIKRRLYRDGQGKYRFLLDEALGLGRRRAMTPLVASYAAALAAHVPFRVAEDLIARAFGLGPSHQSIHNLVAKLGEEELLGEELERVKLFGFGELPEGGAKEANELFLEADGVNISLQREKTKKCEVKVGIAYSGKSGGKTQNKVIHLDLDDGEAFWQSLTVKIVKVFDLKQA